MHALIDCTPLGAGGGMQVAIALLDGLARQTGVLWSAALTETLYHLLPPSVLAQKHRLFLVAKSTFAEKARATLELRGIERNVAPDVVFTVFGPPYFLARAPHLVGFALPHMIYDPDPAIERDNRLSRKAFTHLAAAIFRRATHLVVETETVRTRLATRLGAPLERISVIGNCVNPLLADFAPTPPPGGTPFAFLIPAAYYPHKNLEIVPDVAAAMKRLAPSASFVFRLTLPPADAVWEGIRDRAERLGVGDRVVTLGALPLAELAQAYHDADAVYLPTIREASTAVYPESFHFRRALATSDLDFARELCGDAALYVPCRDAEGTARALIEMIASPDRCAKQIDAGDRRLVQTYPSAREKFQQQVDLLNKVAAMR